MNKKSQQSNPILRYSGMAVQMAITIGAFVWLGLKIDQWQHSGKPVYTAGCSLTGTLVAIFMMIKELRKS